MSDARIVELSNYRPNDKGLAILTALETALDAAVREMGHELTSLLVNDRLDLHEEGVLPVALN